MLRWLLVLPLVFFALFSPGTMLETPPQGGVWIVLCTGEGMVEAVMTPDGRITQDQGSDHDGGLPCDWALHGQSVLASAGTVVDAPLLLELTFRHVGTVPMHVRRAEVLTPAARGPPLIA